MPPVQGPEVPVAGWNIPPRRSRPGPPQDPVDHLPVIVPPTSPTRRPVRQQRLQSRPLCISQIVTIEHKTGLPGRPVKIGETRPSTATGNLRPERPSGTPRCQPKHIVVGALAGCSAL